MMISLRQRRQQLGNLRCSTTRHVKDKTIGFEAGTAFTHLAEHVERGLMTQEEIGWIVQALFNRLRKGCLPESALTEVAPIDQSAAVAFVKANRNPAFKPRNVVSKVSNSLLAVAIAAELSATQSRRATR